MNLLRQGGATDCVPGRTGWGNKLYSWQDRVGQQTLFLAGQGGATDCVPGKQGGGGATGNVPGRTGWGNVLGRTGWGNRQCSWQDKVGQQAALPLHLQKVLGLVDEPSKLGLS